MNKLITNFASTISHIFRLVLRYTAPIIINALLTFVFFLMEIIVNSTSMISFFSVLIIIALFNVIFWWISDYNKKHSNFNERLFTEFTENIHEVFWRATPDLSQVIYVSAAYDEIWGRPRSALQTKPQEWFDAIVPKDRERVSTELDKLTQNDISNVTFEFDIDRPNGELRHIYTRGFKFHDQVGELINILGISADVTLYKKEERAKKILQDISDILRHSDQLATMAPKVLEVMCTAYDWSYGEMLLVDNESNVLRSVSLWDKSEWGSKFDARSQSMTFKRGEILPGEVWAKKEIVWIENINAANLLRTDEATQAGFDSAVGIPILVGNQVVGVLDFFAHDIKRPDDLTAHTLKSICDQMGSFIEKRHTAQNLIYASQHDTQTSLLNRSALKDKIENLLTNSTDDIAILLIDIDRLNLIDSVIGYDATDLLLTLVVDRLRNITNNPNDQIGRYETSVFAFYQSFDQVDELSSFSIAILDIFKEPFFINQENIYLSVNIGIATSNDSNRNIRTLFSHANHALSQSIESGQSNFNFYTPEVFGAVHDQLILESSLRAALINDELRLYYQPKINLKTGEISGAEALLRWQHPVRGLLPPSEFMPLAEKNGLVIQIDEWVLRTVFSLIKNDWPLNPNGKGLIAVNITPNHFKAKYDILGYIKSLMQEFNANPRLIELEITEGVLLDNSRYNLKVLNKLAGMGFNLSLDDFGTGFNSFNYLLRIPSHKVKIDKSFIDGLPNNKISIAIVKALITLCHSLDKKVIAEGVETLEQSHFLKQEGCDEMQGYLFSPPVSLENFKKLIAKHTSYLT